MVLNAGLLLKNRQVERRGRLEIVDVCQLFNQYFRYNGVKIRTEL